MSCPDYPLVRSNARVHRRRALAREPQRAALGRPSGTRCWASRQTWTFLASVLNRGPVFGTTVMVVSGLAGVYVTHRPSLSFVCSSDNLADGTVLQLHLVLHNVCVLRGLTFEVRRDQRQDARPGLVKMYAYHQPGPGGLPLGLASTEGLGRTGGVARAAMRGARHYLTRRPPEGDSASASRDVLDVDKVRRACKASAYRLSQVPCFFGKSFCLRKVRMQYFEEHRSSRLVFPVLRVRLSGSTSTRTQTRPLGAPNTPAIVSASAFGGTGRKHHPLEKQCRRR